MSVIELGDDQGLNVTRERSEARGETFYPGPSRIHLDGHWVQYGSGSDRLQAEVIFKLEYQMITHLMIPG